MNTLHNITNPTIQDKSDIALAFQTAVVDTIRIKCQRAIQQTGLSRLVLAGGVSANLALRDRLKVLGSKHHVEIYYPELKLCTDNGAMIAYAGLQRLRQNHTEDLPHQELQNNRDEYYNFYIFDLLALLQPNCKSSRWYELVDL